MITIGIPVYQGVDLLDVTGPHEVLKWIGDDVQIRLIAETTDNIVSRDGFQFCVTDTFATAPPLDVIWVPGGDPPVLAQMMNRTRPAYLDFLIARAPTAIWVCSVCEGALLLAAAGLLDGHRATTHWLFTPCLKTFDKVSVVDGFPRFVLDGNRLTGGGISSGLDEALELVRLLKGADAAQDVQRTIQYYPEPPFPSDLQAPLRCQFQGLTQPH